MSPHKSNTTTRGRNKKTYKLSPQEMEKLYGKPLSTKEAIKAEMAEYALSRTWSEDEIPYEAAAPSSEIAEIMGSRIVDYGADNGGHLNPFEY